MRAVLDPNVLISGLLSPNGTPGELLRAHQAGEFELVVSPALLAELERVLEDAKLRARIREEDARAFVRGLGSAAPQTVDPTAEPPVRSADPDDDYLIALAASERCALVSGDRDLLALSDRMPVFTTRHFLDFVRPGGA